MANTYNNVPVLAKVKIGDQTYWLKDADVRALLDTYKDAVNYNVANVVTEDGADLVTSAAVYAAIKAGVADLAGAMHFEGVKDEVPTDNTGYVSGDVIIVGNKEYVFDGDEWTELGDESIYLTKATAESDYVKKVITIAGIDLADSITADELKAALSLKALAYKDNATTTLTDYANGIAGAAYTPAGNITVKETTVATDIQSTGTYTPAGKISANTTAAGTIAIARDEAGTAVSGSISTPEITVTPATTTVKHIADLGTLPSYTGATYVAPSVAETNAQFAAEGLVATVDADECLVFTAAATAAALTGTGFNAGSYTAAQFDAGKLPTYGEDQTVVTGIASASATTPIFTGDKFGATFTGSQTVVNAEFTGTEATINVDGKYDKVNVESATFAGTEATITPTLTTGTKVITVE
jgi:hypothetical protein